MKNNENTEKCTSSTLEHIVTVVVVISKAIIENTLNSFFE